MYCICVITPTEHDDARVFTEIAQGLQQGFLEIGDDCPIVHHPQDIRGRAIVLGANLLPYSNTLTIPDSAIVFNLEQVCDTSRWMNPAYLDILRSHQVWDYSERNIGALAAKGISARYCGIGYAPCLTRVVPADPDIDVLFYGSMIHRRTYILKKIEATGLRVHAAYGVYGAKRDALIARSKIVLNLHAFAARVFEITRVSYLLANSRFVLSEHVPTMDSARLKLNAALVYADESQLPELCQLYARNDEAREEIARCGFHLFQSLRQSDYLRAVLD
jgi:hypothetical protein